MSTIEPWLAQLKAQKVLRTTEKDNTLYTHLNTPCKVHIKSEVIKALNWEYDARFEKGGFFVSTPSQIEHETLLVIDEVVFIKNISPTPETSYRMDIIEAEGTYTKYYRESSGNALLLRFHTHPTKGSNIALEAINYLNQSNTSTQDQLVSNMPIKLGDINLLMPRAVVLCNGELANTTFIGFYNGFIAPIEFETHRRKEQSRMLDTLMKQLEKWWAYPKYRAIIISSGLVSLLLLIWKPKVMLPGLFLSAYIFEYAVNNQIKDPLYFAQSTVNQDVIINFPSIYYEEEKS